MSIPTLRSAEYYTEPPLKDLAARELIDPGYSSRVEDFTVGRFGYGCVRFSGETDVRWLDLDKIVKFHRHGVVVYEDESAKPSIGRGLNKPGEVTLILRSSQYERLPADDVVRKLKLITVRQGADFISFDPLSGQWKFSVPHFSRFGLSEDDEEDMDMDEATAVPQELPLEANGGGEDSAMDEENPADISDMMLSHSLPAHLGLDPIKMREMRMMMFPVEEQEAEDFDVLNVSQKLSSGKDHLRHSFQNLSRRVNHKLSPPVPRKPPLALIEYNPGSSDLSSPGNILMSQQNKGSVIKTTKTEGFKLDLTHETPVTGNHSRNVVDAALFMGRSFRVGWGPNGVLVHSGAPVGSNSRVLSSVIVVEKVAIDNVVRDENNKFRKELVDFCFDSPLNLHKAIDHEQMEVEAGTFKIKLQKMVSNRVMLSEICRNYIGIVERQMEVPGLSSSSRIFLMHQVMVWELIKVLFSVREITEESKCLGVDSELEMMHDRKEEFPNVDMEALPFMRKAEFGYWLQESVCQRVQDEIRSLNDSSDLEHIFILLSGRQLDAAVELAASRGDVRLACLLSQAGGSMVNRSDVAHQLEVWKNNGLDFNFIEEERIRLYELLAGNIHAALRGIGLDWRRFLGLLMWYQLPPDTALPAVFNTYKQLIDDGRAPYPIPIYIDEGPPEEASSCGADERFDLSYYLMLLHASEGCKPNFLKSMFSAFSSTCDPFDYHMIWHQREMLQAVGACSSNDLQVLDMGMVSQLLCLGQSHWAIYVVLHMPYHDDYPYLQVSLIREILFQYCESWSSQETQRQFIEDLGIPSAWLDEAMAVYYNYCGDLPKAMKHFLECSNWQRAHSVFITSVAHALFLSGQHEEIWRLVNIMEDHKSEIEHWELGAGIYISFFLLRSSLQDDNNAMGTLDSLVTKNGACKDFFSRLNESLSILATKLPTEARVAYSKMADEICSLLLSDSSEGATYEVRLGCYETAFKAPVPEDLQSRHLQDAVSLFTCYLTETIK